MLITHASQVLTLAGPPQRGGRLGELNIIPDGAVLIRGDQIAALGPTAEMQASFPNEPVIDANGKVILPGFVDPHTHAVWAGDRAAEFELRLQGKTYLEILQAGGGILSTTRKVRSAGLPGLINETRPRLQSMFQHGATTIEVKSGYGLELQSEIASLQAILALDDEGPWELVPTFLGAHAIPAEFSGDPQGYTDHLTTYMLPAVKEWWQNNAKARALPFVDVFCETGAFDLAQSRQILAAAQALGFPLKIHADEFDNLGGAALAAELQAISADHLVVTSDDDLRRLAASDTVAVALPGTPFGLGHTHYTPAKRILELDGLLALASDINPGTAWCENIQFVLALACRYLRLTPAQAIAAATINAAAALGLDDRLGSLEVGKQADLLILSVDDYRHLGYRFGINLVDTVVKHGKLYPNGG